MEITIDLNDLLELGNNPPIVIAWIIFKNGGWIFVLWAFLWGFWRMWIDHRERKYKSGIHYILLSFKIPRENEQSPKAIENIFSQLMGAYSSINFVEKYWQGKVQPKFSLEIVSLEGYIQFLIRTPDKFRDLIEAAFYAQYPEAEITEAADYTQNVSVEKFPSEEYDLQGSEIILGNNDVYPIKTYPDFEHPLTQEFKDPMAALLEIFCRLQKGEQIWIQIIITPDLNACKSLQQKGIKTRNKIAGKKEVVHENLSDKAINLFMSALDRFGEIIYPLWKSAKEKAKEEMPSMMLHLTPGEKAGIEAIEGKISKLSLRTKMRFIYLAKKEVFSSKRGMNPVFGAFQQFNSFGSNDFKPNSKTIIKNFYFFNQTRRNFRKTRLLRRYRARERTAGSKLYMLNTEELATIFHFPVMTNVKTPLISKTISRTAEPPFTLPISEDDISLDQALEHKLRIASAIQEQKEKQEEKPSSINLPTNAPPDNLPIE